MRSVPLASLADSQHSESLAEFFLRPRWEPVCNLVYSKLTVHLNLMCVCLACGRGAVIYATYVVVVKGKDVPEKNRRTRK